MFSQLSNNQTKKMEQSNNTPQAEPKFKKLTAMHYGALILMAVLITTGSLYFGINAVMENDKKFMEGYEAGQLAQAEQTTYSVEVIRDRIKEIDAELYIITPPTEEYADEISEDRYLDEEDLISDLPDDEYNTLYAHLPTPEGYWKDEKGWLHADCNVTVC